MGKHIAFDDGLRQLVEEKLAKAVRFLHEPVEVRVVLEAAAGDKHLSAAELHVAHRTGRLHARAEGPELRENVVAAVASLESQAMRTQKRIVDRRRRAGRNASKERHWPVDVLARESFHQGGRPRVVKSTRIEILPMTIDAAAVRLDASNHEFVVFFDPERERVSVLYRRRDGDYGLIAPEL